MFMALSLFNRVAIVLLALAVVIGGWFLYYRERNNFNEYRTAVIAAAKAQQDKNDLIIQHHERITKKAEITHEKSISSIRSTYNALRVRQPAGSCGMSEVPDATTKPAETAAYYVSIATDLAERCAETTQQLVDLQDVIKEHEQVNNGR